MGSLTEKEKKIKRERNKGLEKDGKTTNKEKVFVLV
jgi:hypothetical protein